MNMQVIQDWTDAQVSLRGEAPRDVRYRVYRQGTKLYQDIHSPDGEPLNTFELPAGVALDKSSYEVLLRFALTEVDAA